MDDLQNTVALMATKLSVHNNSKPLTSTETVTVRCRHVIKQIPRRYVTAYILSLAQKQCLNLEKESFSFLSYVPEVWTNLMDILRSMNTDNYDFGYIQAITLETLKKAIKLCHDTIDKTVCEYFYSRASLNSLNLILDTHSIVNRRRRQEDRWFAVADLLSYVPLQHKSNTDQSLFDKFSPITAFGIFDGHNGPEVAEHCSHLTPYLLSLELQRHILSSGIHCNYSKSIPDILAEVFHRLNQSANNGRAQKCWNSGTTATVCTFAGDTICTAWVGDSQAWLVFPCTNDNNEAVRKLLSNINCCCSRNGIQNNKLYHTTSFHEPERMTVLMEIPSTDRNSDSNNNNNNNNPRVIKSTSLNIMTDHVSLCNGNIPTSQSSPIIERHQKHSQSSLATTAAMLIKQSKDDGTLVHQENPTIHSTLEMNGPLGIPLTDCIHRPESPSEFVSVLRIGGSISTEIGSENSSSIENEIFFSHTPKGSLTNLTIVHDVKDNFSNHNCYNKRVSIPPLNNPGLIDCRVGCLSSVSRSIGDNETVIGLNALPSITLWSVKQSYLNNSITMPLCLIIASDGLWDVPGCSGPEISLLAWYWYKEHIDERKECLNYNSFSEFLINLAIQNGGSDNITCNVIWLHKWKPTNLKGWNIDYPISSSRIRWPRHSRVTSLINLNSSNDILFRGPSDYIYSQMNQSINENYSKLKRSSSFNNNISNHYNSLTPRYSSPPRDIIYDSYL